MPLSPLASIGLDWASGLGTAGLQRRVLGHWAPLLNPALAVLPLLLWITALGQLPGGVLDRSLDALERDQIITPSERRQLERGRLPSLEGRQAPRSPALVKLCQRGDGAVNQRECSSPGFRYSPEGLPLPPLSVPVNALLSGASGSFSLRDVLRITPRPAPLAGNGNRSLLFPLIGSAIPSSGFGWRLHPIFGSLMLHAGRDLAAPEGTPVVAALDGEVITSGLAGGYGLAVMLEHPLPQRQRTLYGHLSELFVEPGESVRQGEVIGRVGSTGLSTGPHLHFELRRPAARGWVAVDPGELTTAAGGPTEQDPVGVLIAELLRGLKREP